MEREKEIELKGEKKRQKKRRRKTPRKSYKLVPSLETLGTLYCYALK